MPSPRFEKNFVAESTCAKSATCGPIRIPSRSSTTTTGRTSRGETSAEMSAAEAAIETMTRKETASTPIMEWSARGRLGFARYRVEPLEPRGGAEPLEDLPRFVQL